MRVPVVMVVAMIMVVIVAGIIRALPAGRDDIQRQFKTKTWIPDRNIRE